MTEYQVVERITDIDTRMKNFVLFEIKTSILNIYSCLLTPIKNSSLHLSKDKFVNLFLDVYVYKGSIILNIYMIEKAIGRLKLIPLSIITFSVIKVSKIVIAYSES